MGGGLLCKLGLATMALVGCGQNRELVRAAEMRLILEESLEQYDAVLASRQPQTLSVECNSGDAPRALPPNSRHLCFNPQTAQETTCREGDLIVWCSFRELKN